jgi:peptidyl-prolyl cis-trans isomerase C
MTFKPARLLLALLAVCAMPVFAQNLAVVNGKPIPSSRVDAMVKVYIAQNPGKQDTPQLREAMKQDLITREVMLQEAVKGGFEKNADVVNALARARQDILTSALMRDHMTKNPITAAEMKTVYDTAKSKADDKEYHIRHILVATDAEAKAVVAKLKGGAKFEELAKTSLDAGTAANGGDLEWVSTSALPKPFGDAILALKKGEVTQNAVQTDGGFHIVKLDEVRPAKPFPPFEEVKPQVQQQLQAEKLQAYQETLRKKAKITN